MALTKDDIIQAVAKENGYSLHQSIEIIETPLEIINSKLASGEDVLISGFGRFCVKKKKKERSESGDRWGYDAATQEGGDFQVVGKIKAKDKRINPA